MVDKQRLIYDLALQCAALKVQHNPQSSLPLEAQMATEFIESIRECRRLYPKIWPEIIDELNNA